MIAKIMNRVDFGGLVNYAHNDKSQTKRANLLAHEGGMHNGQQDYC